MSLVSRAASLMHRINWLAPYAGGSIGAAQSLVRFKQQPGRAHALQFAGGPFYCRKADLQAVREVLVDREYAFLAPLLSTNEHPRIVDVGAHIGTFSMWALQAAPGARILSIEADPDTYAVVARNAEIRRASGGDWTVINRAAALEEDGIVRFAQDGPSMSHRVSSTGGIEVPTIGLRGALHRVGGTADLLKVDIEGSEDAFFGGSPDLLEQVKAIVVELHPGLCDTDRVRRLLSDRYQSVEEVPNRMSSKPLLYAH